MRALVPGVLALGATLIVASCVHTSSQHPSPAPQQPPAALPAPYQPPAQVQYPLVPQRQPQVANACATSLLPPFNEPLVWRAAYRGSGKTMHNCVRWSSFGPVRPRGKWHKGIDVAAPTGTPIRAAAAGVLQYGRDPNGWGLYARLRIHPVREVNGQCVTGEPLDLIYAHLDDHKLPFSIRGDHPVEPGTVVGFVGCSGNARGMCSPSPESHVHITVRQVDKARTKIDPLPVLGWPLLVPAAEQFSPPLSPCLSP